MLLVLAFVANRLSKWTRVPDVIVLLITGIALGPVLHSVNGSKFSEVTRGFGTLALILILFAAGLELDLRSALKQFGVGTFSRCSAIRFLSSASLSSAFTRCISR